MPHDPPTGPEREPAGTSPSRVIADKYRLGRMLGEGGMGAVYEAEHLGLGARVAIKLMSDGCVTDPKAIARFRAEARAMGAIRHENVVSVMDTGTDDDGAPFLVMELLRGESLSALLRRDRTLSAERASWIASQLLAGLAVAHAKGIVHRDLKPGNVFLARQDDGTIKAKILDFGISKLLDSSPNVTSDGAMIGTPNYMAPEQIRGDSDLDARVDVYAVGVLLYRMTTGKLPFAATSSEELYRKILDGKPTPPRERRADIPEVLETVIRNAMAPERELRYASAQALRESLHQAVPHLQQMVAEEIRGHVRDAAEAAALASIVRKSQSGPTAVERPARAHSAADHSRSPGRHVLLGAGAALAVIAIAAALLSALRGSDREDGQAKRAQAVAVDSDGPPLRFGHSRYFKPELVEARAKPLIDYLASRLGRRVTMVVADDGDRLAELLVAGEVDVAALSASAYVRAKRLRFGIRLLAKTVAPGGSPTYTGYILTRSDSGIQSLDGLRDKIFCYVSPGSTSGWVFPRAVFRRHGMDPDTSFRATRFGGDHLETLRALYRGDCDGAVVFEGAWHTAGQHGMPPERFRSLGFTDPMPYDAYSVRDDMPREMADQIEAALLALAPGSEVARRALGDGAGQSPFIGFVPAADSDYDIVRDNLDVADGKLAP